MVAQPAPTMSTQLPRDFRRPSQGSETTRIEDTRALLETVASEPELNLEALKKLGWVVIPVPTAGGNFLRSIAESLGRSGGEISGLRIGEGNPSMPWAVVFGGDAPNIAAFATNFSHTDHLLTQPEGHWAILHGEECTLVAGTPDEIERIFGKTSIDAIRVAARKDLSVYLADPDTGPYWRAKVGRYLGAE